MNVENNVRKIKEMIGEPPLLSDEFLNYGFITSFQYYNIIEVVDLIDVTDEKVIENITYVYRVLFKIYDIEYETYNKQHLLHPKGGICYLKESYSRMILDDIYSVNIQDMYIKIINHIFNSYDLSEIIDNRIVELFKLLYSKYEENKRISIILKGFLILLNQVAQDFTIHQKIRDYSEVIYHFVKNKYDLIYFDTTSFYIKDEFNIDLLADEFPIFNFLIDKKNIYILAKQKYILFNDEEIIKYPGLGTYYTIEKNIVNNFIKHKKRNSIIDEITNGDI